MRLAALASALVVTTGYAIATVRPGPANDGTAAHQASPRTTEPRRGRPSPYWLLERRYLEQEHTMGNLGSTVRELRHVNRRLGSALASLRATHARAVKTFRSAAGVVGSSWLERAFMCIHAHEGAWDDPNAPYYGGMQMDYEFQRSYGPEFLRAWGTADHWPASVQMAVAIRAYLSGRGFNPWPNTSAMCGLR